MSITIDESNPCEAVRVLRQVYLEIVAGSQAQIVTFKGGATGVERSVTYNKASPDRLLVLIRQYEGQCQLLQGGKPRRFAVRGGGI